MKVLILDDSYSWQEFHKNNIEEIFIELDIKNYQIDTVSWAKEGYDAVMQNIDEPYQLIISDLQMEDDFKPQFAGEWFAEQVKTFKQYLNTKIVLCSASYNIKQIAENLSVNFIPKRIAITDINNYKNSIIKLLK